MFHRVDVEVGIARREKRFFRGFRVFLATGALVRLWRVPDGGEVRPHPPADEVRRVVPGLTAILIGVMPYRVILARVPVAGGGGEDYDVGLEADQGRHHVLADLRRLVHKDQRGMIASDVLRVAGDGDDGGAVVVLFATESIAAAPPDAGVLEGRREMLDNIGVAAHQVDGFVFHVRLEENLRVGERPDCPGGIPDGGPTRSAAASLQHNHLDLIGPPSRGIGKRRIAEVAKVGDVANVSDLPREEGRLEDYGR